MNANYKLNVLNLPIWADSKPLCETQMQLCTIISAYKWHSSYRCTRPCWFIIFSLWYFVFVFTFFLPEDSLSGL